MGVCSVVLSKWHIYVISLDILSLNASSLTSISVFISMIPQKSAKPIAFLWESLE